MDTTKDAFLGGRLTLRQPKHGYRAGVDPVLLAAAVKARAGASVLELGCGPGAAILCLAARVPDLVLHGVELQEDYATLARENATSNDIALTVWQASVDALPADLNQMTFDHVIANPPYFFQPRYRMNLRDGRGTAMAETVKLAAWIDTATRRLKPKGWLTLIQDITRLPDVLRALDGRMGTLSVYPIAARVGRAPDRFILRARKAGMTPFALSASVVMHQGDAHLKDGDDYTPEIAAVLRNGAQFPFRDQ